MDFSRTHKHKRVKRSLDAFTQYAHTAPYVYRNTKGKAGSIVSSEALNDAKINNDGRKMVYRYHCDVICECIKTSSEVNEALSGAQGAHKGSVMEAIHALSVIKEAPVSRSFRHYDSINKI